MPLRLLAVSLDAYHAFLHESQGTRHPPVTPEEERQVAAVLTAYLALCHQLVEWILIWGIPSRN